MYGVKIHSMLKDLSDTWDHIPPFNEEDFKKVGKELHTMHIQNLRDIRGFAYETDTQGAIPSVVLRHGASKYIQRCVLAYMYNRLQKIRKMRWDFGSILPFEIKANLSSNEIEWAKSYSSLLAEYMTTIGDNIGLDITQDIKPPKSFCVEVKGTENYGRYELEGGCSIVLRKDQCYLLERSQCEVLIRKGIVEHIV